MSFVQLLRVENKPCIAVEWVKENSFRLNELAAPGLYYLDFIEDNQFMVDPLYEINQLLFKDYISGQTVPTFTLENTPVIGAIEMLRGQKVGDRIFMCEGEHFILNRTTGEGEITEPDIDPDITIRYWSPGPSEGPFTFEPNTVNLDAIPGVALAFGRRARKGDKQAVRVTRQREATAEAVGGKWELAMEIEAWALDPDSANEIMDFLVTMLWGYHLERYATEGIAFTNFDIGGETAEAYDEATDQTWFTVTSTISALTDWELHIPKPFFITAIDGVDAICSGMPPERRIKPVVGKPTLVGRNFDFERIK